MWRWSVDRNPGYLFPWPYQFCNPQTFKGRTFPNLALRPGPNYAMMTPICTLVAIYKRQMSLQTKLSMILLVSAPQNHHFKYMLPYYSVPHPTEVCKSNLGAFTKWMAWA